MSNQSPADAALLERLSALADGQLDAAAAAAVCCGWSQERAAQSSWHAYQLIGDVLRSEDLAADPARDAALLEAVRKRLAAEPVVLAPGALAPQTPQAADAHASPASAPIRAAGGHRAWRVPSAVAAGFLAVAGVFMLTRTAPPPQSTGLIASAPGAGAALVGAGTAATPLPDSEARRTVAEAAPMPRTPTDPRVIRDARLDAYLAAHKQFAGSSALGLSSPLVRNVTVESTER